MSKRGSKSALKVISRLKSGPRSIKTIAHRLKMIRKRKTRKLIASTTPSLPPAISAVFDEMITSTREKKVKYELKQMKKKLS